MTDLLSEFGSLRLLWLLNYRCVNVRRAGSKKVGAVAALRLAKPRNGNAFRPPFVACLRDIGKRRRQKTIVCATSAAVEMTLAESYISVRLLFPILDDQVLRNRIRRALVGGPEIWA